MDYVELGNTGLDVSPICLGCMSYDSPNGAIPGCTSTRRLGPDRRRDPTAAPSRPLFEKS
jgi:aryl-alcohol dehydrogenase-like predicted oxidoreductase